MLTESQKRQVVAMRENGIGYQTIATTIGVTRDQVRNLCKTRKLDGYGSQVKRKIQEGILCLYCGKKIEQSVTGRRKKFCCEKCRREWWKVHADALNKRPEAFYGMVCNCCKKEFMSYGNKTRKYCSHKCYIQARFWTENEGKG